jgi:threonine/homoserine/homoserine lactone efflux protein
VHLSWLVPTLAILGGLFVGVVSPGPSFVLVARVSVARSRRDGLAAALGMGVGGVVFGSLALLGLNAVLAEIGWLYLALKLAGALYLIYLAIGLWRAADKPLDAGAIASAGEAGHGRSFRLGLATQLSNPKGAVFYASVFAALLPQHPPLGMVLALPPLLFCLEAGWYALVALAFSAGRPRRLYLGAKRWIDRIAGAVVGMLGLRLMIEAVRPS